MGLRPNDLTDEAFIGAFVDAGCSPTRMSQMVGMAMAPLYKRLSTLRNKGHELPVIPLPGAGGNKYQATGRAYSHNLSVSFPDGVVVAFSDAHWWPGQERTVAHEALLKVIKSIRPGMVIANGDVFDGPNAGRHEPKGWENRPTIIGELEAVKEHMAAIAKAAKGAALLRTIGNHDERFDTKLAVRVPDYRHLAGMALRDHLPDWAEAWRYAINDAVMVKHRWHTGIHATYNNVLKAGRSIVTSHTHRLKIEGFTDYNGRRWGVDTGSLSESEFAQFDYAEGNPKNWGSGFAVLTFRRGQLQPPELCEVIHGRAVFRGEVIHEAATDKGVAKPAGGAGRKVGGRAARAADCPG